MRIANVDTDKGGSGIEVITRIPHWCSHVTGASDDIDDSRVSTGALIAMLDEVSTYAGSCLFDQLGRPGLSIHLSASLRNQTHSKNTMPSGGDELRFVSRGQRFGRTMGFLEVQVFNEQSGDLIMEGRHIKQLAMPFAVAGGNPVMLGGMRRDLQPYTIALCEKFMMPKERAEKFEHRSIDEVFPLTMTTQGNLENDNEHVYSAEIGYDHGNPVGGIHGGAGVMLGEAAARPAAEQAFYAAQNYDAKQSTKRRPLQARSISTTLLSSVQARKKKMTPVVVRSALLETEQQESGITAMSSRSTIESRGGPAIECHIDWCC